MYAGTAKTVTRGVEVLTSKGEELVLDASGSSALFHQGENAMLTYRGETGSIIKATFLRKDGTVEGHFQGSDLWSAYICLIGGVLFAYEGYQKHKRDPEGSEELYHRKSMPLTGVDSASLLQLSNKRRVNQDS